MKILILHGWRHNKSMWSQTVEQLKTVAPTEAIDLPGFGDEPLVNETWGIPEYATWVEEYIKKNKLNEVVLLGHSFGGRIASLLASQNPSWMKAIILVASPSIYRPSKNTLLKIKIYKTIRKFVPKFIQKTFYTSELQDADNNNLGQVFRKIVNFDQTNQLQKIHIPTLLVWGENDNEVKTQIAFEMHQLIKNSKLEIIKNAGHMPSLDNPSLFYGIIKHFVKNL